MTTHYRTRQGQLTLLRLRDGRRFAWHFTRERSTRIEFREGTIQKRELLTFVPLSGTKQLPPEGA